MSKKKRKKAPLAQRKANPNSMYWRRQADEAWSEQIRSVGKCEICGRASSLNAHHLIARGRLRFRHNLSNGVCLCSHCHNFNANVSPHVDSFSGERFLVWLELKRHGQWVWYEENKDDMRTLEYAPLEETYKDAYRRLKNEI